MNALIGVDIGTQGTKAAVFSEDGECLGTAFCASNLHRPKPGVVEEDPEAQYRSVCETIRGALKKAKLASAQVKGIGIAGQMAGVIGVGRDGRHVTPYDSWLDQRCAAQIRLMDAAAGDQVLAKSGCAPGFNHGPKIMWWKATRPRDYRRVASFVQPSGYAAMRLCGLSAADAFIDKTYLHFSGFANNPRSTWDPDLCERFGVDPAKLPQIVDPQSVVGELSAEPARACGLKAGVPVVAGCGDTAASFLACGAVKEGVGVDVAGTASVFAATTAAFRPDRKHRILGCGQSAVPGLWHPYAYIGGGGMNLEWFRREIANHGRTDGKGRIAFDALNEIASALSPDASDPFFVPHLAGRACPVQPELRGAWVGLTWDHSLAHLYRAVLESIALEYGIYQRVLGQLYPHFRLAQLRITGGGERSELWNQMKADTLGTTVCRVEGSHGAPAGAAMVAGWGVGVLKDLPSAARNWIQMGAQYRPVAKRRNSARIEKYERLLGTLNDFAKDH